MGKRSGFKLVERGYYPTPVEALAPLVPHLPEAGTFWEPCAGAGHLVDAMAALRPGLRSVSAIDLVPQRDGIAVGDATVAVCPASASVIVTNPPWPLSGRRGEPVLSILRNLASQRPTWLLLPWAFHANAYAAGMAGWCVRVLPIGRVSWMGNGVAGKDDCAWSLWDAAHAGPTLLDPRYVKEMA